MQICCIVFRHMQEKILSTLVITEFKNQTCKRIRSKQPNVINIFSFNCRTKKNSDSNTRNVGVSTISMAGPIDHHYSTTGEPSGSFISPTYAPSHLGYATVREQKFNQLGQNKQVHFSASPIKKEQNFITELLQSFFLQSEQDVMLAHVTVPMMMMMRNDGSTSSTTSSLPRSGHQIKNLPPPPPAFDNYPPASAGGSSPTSASSTYTVDSLSSKGVIVSPGRHNNHRHHLHHLHHHPLATVSVIEEEMSTVSTPLMSTSSLSSRVINPRESAV